jgi:poly(hydroxyalkanoate) granule-associated protein
MLKKAKEAAAKGEPASGSTKDIAQAVLDSSHQIWLAGVGAFVKARQEGTKAFETLVQQGEKLEQRTKLAAAETAVAASAKAKEMQHMASGTWDKLEQVFEDRVARALSKLGVYTQNDVQKLADRVETLSAAVNELLNASATGTGAGTKRTQRPKRPSPRTRAKATPATGKTKKTARKR